MSSPAAAEASTAEALEALTLQWGESWVEQQQAAMAELSTSLEMAEELEADGKYREAAELAASAMTRAHRRYVQTPSSQALQLPRQRSSVTLPGAPRRSVIERYKAESRVDWKKWDRCSVMQPPGGDRDSWEDGEEEEEAAASERAEKEIIVEEEEEEEEEEEDGGEQQPGENGAGKAATAVSEVAAVVAEAAAAASQEVSGSSGPGAPPPAAAMARRASMLRNTTSSRPSLHSRRSSISVPSNADWTPETLTCSQAPGVSYACVLTHKCGDGTELSMTLARPALPSRAPHLFNTDAKRTVRSLLAGDAELCERAHTYDEIAL